MLLLSLAMLYLKHGQAKPYRTEFIIIFMFY